MSKTIQQIYDLRDVVTGVPYDVPKLVCPMPALLYGLELEIEFAEDMSSVVNMRSTEDGSLRNFGVEFITEPLDYSRVMYTLNEFFTRNKVYFKGDNYSERTSIHVHVNCLNLTYQQVASVLLVYQVFESLLFRFIGHDRDKNIFCVPLSECAISYQAAENISNGNLQSVRRWMKYTALNLLPLETQGTIEFRHMEGNNNLERIGIWLRFIASIIKYATDYSYEEIKTSLSNLNTNSHYRNALQQVFGYDADVLTYPDSNEMIENGVLNMKYSILKPVSYFNSNKKSINDILIQMPHLFNEAPRVDAPERNVGPAYVIMDDLVRDLAVQEPEQQF